MPIALAMTMCRIPHTPTTSTNQDPYKTALSILLPLGEYFQAQDDYLDYSAPPHVLGKIGTDIIDNKCSWCINTALRHCTPSQRLILEQNYGKKDKVVDEEGRVVVDGGSGGECEKRVREVFESGDVRMGERWEEYEKGMVGRLRETIATYVDELHHITVHLGLEGGEVCRGVVSRVGFLARCVKGV